MTEPFDMHRIRRGHFAGAGAGTGVAVGAAAGGVLGAGVAAGADAGALAGIESSTEPLPLEPLEDISERINEVAMKIPADQAVRRDSRVAAPRAPNAVCDPPPPNAPARSARFPVWRRTTRTKNTATITWRIVSKISIAIPFDSDLKNRRRLARPCCGGN
jgi:hypothetical protein